MLNMLYNESEIILSLFGLSLLFRRIFMFYYPRMSLNFSHRNSLRTFFFDQLYKKINLSISYFYYIGYLKYRKNQYFVK